jgi:hypothetical protein
VLLKVICGILSIGFLAIIVSILYILFVVSKDFLGATT